MTLKFIWNLNGPEMSMINCIRADQRRRYTPPFGRTQWKIPSWPAGGAGADEMADTQKAIER